MTITEAVEISGRTYQSILMAIRRGKLKATKEPAGWSITDEDLLEFMVAQGIVAAAELPADERPDVLGPRAREYGMAISRLPQAVKDAILDGLPTSKKAGGPEQYQKAVRNLPRQPIVDIGEEQDPNRGFPVGHQHRDQPRWKRTGQNTWSDDQGSTWTWNGMFWEAGGRIEGRGPLPDGISPADPNSDLRPLIPSVQVKK